MISTVCCFSMAKMSETVSIASCDGGSTSSLGMRDSHQCGHSANASLTAFIVVSSDSFLEFCSRSAPVEWAVSRIHTFLLNAGAPESKLPKADDICLSVVATVLTLLFYFFAFGKRHVRRRKRLAEELRLAQLQVHYLEEKLMLAQAEDMSATAFSSSLGKKREVRIFMDGAFDMMHYGHMNAFRLGRSLGTHLVVGVNSDESITECKGAPLMNDQERLTMVQGCKFVDEVVPGCPYVMNSEYLDYVIQKFKIDYVIHGDDPCIVDGKDVYAAAKAKGKYRSIPRTEGVSTTDIVGRMLIMTKDHHHQYPPKHDKVLNVDGEESEGASKDITRNSQTRWMLGQKSKFLTTSRMLRMFSAGVKAPTEEMRVIYMDGAWDMFHCGHVAILKAAKQRGDYLIVGIHGDSVVNQQRGSNLPLMNLHERVLSVLGCRYVDDVLIDAPYEVSPDMVASLKIQEVVRGSRSDDIGNGYREREGDRYRHPREAGILTVIESPSDFNLGSIVKRIQKNQSVFQAKFDRKMKAENEYYNERYRSGDSSL